MPILPLTILSTGTIALHTLMMVPAHKRPFFARTGQPSMPEMLGLKPSTATKPSTVTLPLKIPKAEILPAHKQPFFPRTDQPSMVDIVRPPTKTPAHKQPFFPRTGQPSMVKMLGIRPVSGMFTPPSFRSKPIIKPNVWRGI